MRLHVVDGTYELFRAYFSKRPSHTAPSGLDVKATLGVMSSMIALLHDLDEQVTHIGVAFDNPIESFRNALFDGYKTGDGMPEDLAQQFDLVEEAVASLGITVWSMKEHEADDGLSTAAYRFKEQVDQVRIMTPDKDLGQCIEGVRVVQVDRMRSKVIDETAHLLEKGISPKSVPDFLALVGDSADGIPGLPGFGKKSAAQLLRRYGHIEAIPKDAAEWDVDVRGKDRLGETLANEYANALLYRTLATLVTDAPITKRLSDLEWKGADKDGFFRLLERLDAERMKERIDRFRR